MNKNEYKKLIDSINIIKIEDLINKANRTLLYGYTCERATWHVYIENNEIYVLKYDYNGEPKQLNVVDNLDYIPNKRLYPEACDYEFCTLLKMDGINLPFTAWNEERGINKYYGKTLLETI